MTVILLMLGKLWRAPWVRTVGICLALLAAIILTHVAAYYRGAGNGAAKAHAEDAAAQAAALARAESVYRAKELTNEKQIEGIRVEYAARAATETALDAHAGGDLRAGTQRMRVAVARCSPVPAAPGPTASRADVAETAELAPEVAGRLYAIAADGDAAIRQLTALQAWAKSAVTLCGGQARR